MLLAAIVVTPVAVERDTAFADPVALAAGVGSRHP
jgi:hypothetical protein